MANYFGMNYDDYYGYQMFDMADTNDDAVIDWNEHWNMFYGVEDDQHYYDYYYEPWTA